MAGPLDFLRPSPQSPAGNLQYDQLYKQHVIEAISNGQQPMPQQQFMQQLQQRMQMQRPPQPGAMMSPQGQQMMAPQAQNALAQALQQRQQGMGQGMPMQGRPPYGMV